MTSREKIAGIREALKKHDAKLIPALRKEATGRISHDELHGIEWQLVKRTMEKIREIVS